MKIKFDKYSPNPFIRIFFDIDLIIQDAIDDNKVFMTLEEYQKKYFQLVSYVRVPVGNIIFGTVVRNIYNHFIEKYNLPMRMLIDPRD